MVGNIHYIKCKSEYFSAVWDGKKNFELRKNDRYYEVGDIVCMREVNDAGYTGRVVILNITYVLKGFKGLDDEYCIFSWESISKGNDSELTVVNGFSC